MARTVQELEAEKREWDLLFAQEAWKKLIHLKQEVVKNLSEGWEEKFTTDEQLHMARGYIKALKLISIYRWKRHKPTRQRSRQRMFFNVRRGAVPLS